MRTTTKDASFKRLLRRSDAIIAESQALRTKPRADYVKCLSTNPVRSPLKTGNTKYRQAQIKARQSGTIATLLITRYDGLSSSVEFSIDQWHEFVRMVQSTSFETINNLAPGDAGGVD